MGRKIMILGIICLFIGAGIVINISGKVTVDEVMDTSYVVNDSCDLSLHKMNYYENILDIRSNNEKLTSFVDINGNLDQPDQHQPYLFSGLSKGVYGEPNKLAQSFKPTLEILTRVQVKLSILGHPDGLRISIHDSLDGPYLASLYIHTDKISFNSVGWVEFDFRDIVVSPEKTYYIVWDPLGATDEFNTFYWFYEDGNPYGRGSMWNFSEDWNWNNQRSLDFCFITYGYKYAPNPPVITGPTSGMTDKELIFNFSATDPDYDKIFYYVEWGDNQVEDWLGPYNSGKEITVSHIWNEPGIYDIRAKAKDELDVEGEWSEPFTVTVLNDAPSKPERPSGPTNGKAMQTYSYTTSSTDPEGHGIKYGWDWDGDNIEDQWTNYYTSGQTISTPHVWNDQGTYEIKVKSMDEYGEESSWSDPLSVSMPKNKAINIPFLDFLENHPYLFPLLRQILNL